MDIFSFVIGLWIGYVIGGLVAIWAILTGKLGKINANLPKL